MRQRLEYALAWCVVKVVGAAAPSLGARAAITLAWTVYLLHGDCVASACATWRWLPRKEPRANAPESCAACSLPSAASWRKSACFPGTPAKMSAKVVVYDGFENFERALARGKGVLFLTAHLGGWELSAFAHSLHGHPLHFVMRPLDNSYLDRLVRRYRTMHGNTTVGQRRLRPRTAARR